MAGPQACIAIGIGIGVGIGVGIDFEEGTGRISGATAWRGGAKRHGEQLRNIWETSCMHAKDHLRSSWQALGRLYNA